MTYDKLHHLLNKTVLKFDINETNAVMQYLVHVSPEKFIVEVKLKV